MKKMKNFDWTKGNKGRDFVADTYPQKSVAEKREYGQLIELFFSNHGSQKRETFTTSNSPIICSQAHRLRGPDEKATALPVPNSGSQHAAHQ